MLADILPGEDELESLPFAAANVDAEGRLVFEEEELVDSEDEGQQQLRSPTSAGRSFGTPTAAPSRQTSLKAVGSAKKGAERGVAGLARADSPAGTYSSASRKLEHLH